MMPLQKQFLHQNENFSVLGLNLNVAQNNLVHIGYC